MHCENGIFFSAAIKLTEDIVCKHKEGASIKDAMVAG